jgi:CBS domain containing-hemolysin-like protein
MLAKVILLVLSLPLPVLIIASAAGEESLPGLNTLLVPAIIIIILVMFNALFVMAEFAIISVRPSQLEQLTNEGNHTAERVLAMVRSTARQNHYIATAQLGITIASLGLGMYGEPELGHFVEPYLAFILGADSHSTLVTTIGYIMAVSILTYLHVVLGEMAPKSLALAAPNRAMFTIYRPMRLTQTLLDWPVRLLNAAGNALLKMFHIPPAEGHARLHSPEELELIVSDSVKGGLLNEEERELVEKIFDFSERQVNQVMTPRPRVEAIAHDTPLPDILAQVANSQHSRFPVYEGDLDNIIGVIHLKDLVRLQRVAKGAFDIRLLLRPVPIVPEHYLAEKMLATLKRRRTHLAIVLDEFGGTAGIVTLEDLVEAVVGEVRDEFDVENEPIVEVAPGALEVQGTYLLDDLQEYVYLGEEEELPSIETVGGLIMTELGRVPQVGDQFTLRDSIHFTVLAVDGLTVARARIEYPTVENQEE